MIDTESQNYWSNLKDIADSFMSKSARGCTDKPGRNVAQKSGLNRSILDQDWGEFRRHFEYKKDRESVWWFLLTLSIRVKLVLYAATKRKRIV